MERYTNTILNKQGKPVAGAVVTVTTYPGNEPAVIYAVDGGQAVEFVTSDENGRFAFYAADGHYNLSVTGRHIAPFTITDVVLNDPTNDAPPVVQVVLPPRAQVVATRGRFPVTAEGGGATNYTRFESSLVVRTGPRPVNSIQLLYCNRYAIGGGEVWSGVNDLGLESAVNYGGVTNPVTFTGWKSPTMAAGAALVHSDKLGLNLPANTALQLRSGAIVASGQKTPGGQPSSFQYAAYSSTASVSQVYGTSSMAAPSGGATSIYGFVPLAVIGIPDHRHVAVLLWGDSITFGTGDASNGESTYGHVGWAERGLVGAAAGVNIPFVNVSKPGDSTATWGAGAIGYHGTRWALLEYVTHAVFAMGINDIVAGRTLAQLQANCQVAWAAAKRMGAKVFQTTLTPNTTSTDSWATLANQTVVANYTAAGIRGQFNAWLPSQVAAGNIDGLIDLNAAVCDPNNTDKWAVNGVGGYLTADGIHPSSAGHALMGAVMKAQASAWTV